MLGARPCDTRRNKKKSLMQNTKKTFVETCPGATSPAFRAEHYGKGKLHQQRGKVQMLWSGTLAHFSVAV